MPTNTYVALATQTLGSATASVTFSSISSAYTDLRIVIAAKDGSANTYGAALLTFNSDTASNYSFTNLYGDGTAAGSSRALSQSNSDLLIAGGGASNFGITNVDIMNYSNATTFKTFISRGNTTQSYVNARVGLWRKTPEAITSITLTSGSGNFAAGSTFSLYGIKAEPVWAAKATGGTITNDVQYTYHTFTASGTFTPLQTLSCDYLVVAGGGGGGYERGAGGGAGGLRCTVDATGGGGSLESPLSLSATGYTVTIGGGGAGLTGYTAANPGSNSVFGAITSTGGGGGGGTDTSARNGGSGGGAHYIYTGSVGTGTANQGFNGGLGFSPAGGGGGGGAGAVGVAAIVTKAGNGGAGVATSISGSSVTYAGGGGGAGEAGITIGTGGAGGGGNGTNNASTGGAGTANRGGGGGGGGFQNPNPGNGGAGGSGIVIIRYAN